jgi:hypothetical protein
MTFVAEKELDIGAWARSNNLVRLSQITPDALDYWKSSWSPKAKNPNDRIGKTTAGRLKKIRCSFATACAGLQGAPQQS